MNGVVYACDVGSTRSGAFAWVRADLGQDGDEFTGSQDIEALADALVADLATGRPISLGFEAPLFIPVPDDPSELSAARPGEGSSSFSAPPGLAVATLGLHQLAWILRRIQPAGGLYQLTFDPDDWDATDSNPALLLWEAFVSGTAHSSDHLADAATACQAFVAFTDDPTTAATVTAETPISLAGAAALWSGWRSDIGVLEQPALVLKPDEPAAVSVKLL